MLVVPDIRENREAILDGLAKRNFKDASKIIDQILDLDSKRRKLQGDLDSVLAESNQLAKQIGQLMRAGDTDQADEIKGKTADLKSESSDLRDRQNEVSNELRELLCLVPNVPHPSVVSGQTEDDNEILLEWGEDPVLPPDAVPHWDLIKTYDIIDFELGTKVTGAGFPIYKGKGAKLQRALINFFLKEAENAGYLEVQPPIVINEDSGFGTGQLPDKEGQMYHARDDNFFLIPTAEVPITNMYRDEILKMPDLPIKNVGYTPCFRREAGSWGAHVRGLNRLHQFDKVEIVQVQHPDHSYEALDEMSAYIQSLLQKLNLKYRVLRLCGGDLGFTSALTYDMEVYSSAQKKWLEVSSVSNFETYQSNRLKLRYKDDDGKSKLLHTLNGSALALPRIVAAILENNQTDKGILIPEILKPFCGFEVID